MTNVITNEQILNAAFNDIVNHINKGTFKGLNASNMYEENFYSITSLYAQWGCDRIDAERNLWLMYEQNFPQYFNGF